MCKRSFCFLMALAILLALVPVSASAQQDQIYTQGQRDVWLEAGQTPQYQTEKGCQWTLTGQEKQESILSCQKDVHAHSFLCQQDGSGAYLCSHHTAHTQSCYETLYPQCPAPHSHSESCGSRILYSCHQEEAPGHSHVDNCYALICGLEAGAGAHSHSPETCPYTMELACGFAVEHIHGESCYTVCQEDHEHTDDCSAPILICTLPVHTHTDSCRKPGFTCPIPESTGHVHAETCRQLSCGLEAGAGRHNHQETGCTVEATEYLCGMSEHTHNDDCATQQKQICGVDTLETHITEGCSPDCPIPEHSHSENCYTLVTMREWAVTPIPPAQLTIRKIFGPQVTVPQGTIVKLEVLDDEGNCVAAPELSEETGWSVTLENLIPGSYTIREINSALSGHSRIAADSSILAEGTQSHQILNDSAIMVALSSNASASVTFAGQYQKWETGDFWIVNTAQDGSPLAGISFALYDDQNRDVTLNHLDTAIASEAVTDSDGKLHFHNFQTENEETATYYLKQISTPAGYTPKERSWILTVSQESDGYSMEIADEDYDSTTRTLGVQNSLMLLDLTITAQARRFVNGETASQVPQRLKDAGYREQTAFHFTITLTAPDQTSTAFEKTVDLADGDPDTDCIKLSIPYGYGYRIQQKTGPFASSIANGRAVMVTEDVTAAVTNTFYYFTADADHTNDETSSRSSLCLNFISVDQEGQLLSGAAFSLTGPAQVKATTDQDRHHFCIGTPGLYYLKQESAPLGYKANNTRYKAKVTSSYRVHTASVNGSAVPAIIETLHLDEAGSKLPPMQEDCYQIQNDLDYVNVRVSVRWRVGRGITKPASAKVAIYANGVLMDTATVSPANNWTYTWKDLPANMRYTVDELNPPAGFYKKVRQTLTNRWTITNSAYLIPMTGDDFDPGLWTAVMIATGTALAAGGYWLLKKKKKI